MKRVFIITSVLLLSFLCFSPLLIAQQSLREGSAYLPLGHCNYVEPEFERGTGWAIGTFGDKEVGMWARVSRSMLTPYHGCQIVGVRIGMAGKVSDVNVQLLNNTIKRETLRSKRQELLFGWNEVRFDEPLDISDNLNEIVYGFQFQEKNIANKDWPLAFAFDRNTQGPKDGYYVNVSGGYFDSRTTECGSLLVQLMIVGPAEQINDKAILLEPRLDKAFDPSGKLGVSYVVRNAGANEISQLEISYSVDGTVVYQDLQTKPVGHIKELPFRSVGIPVSNGKTLTARITKVNQKATDLPGFSVEVKGVAEKSMSRKVLLEQASTEECSSCPGAHKYLADVLKEETYKGRFVWVTHHVGFLRDKFSIPESEAILIFFEEQDDNGAYIESAPAMMLDRTHTTYSHYSGKYTHTFMPIFPGENKFNRDLFEEALSRPAFISVNIEENCNPETRKLDLTVSGEGYRDQLDLNNLYLNIYLVEDNILSYDQNGTGKAPNGGKNPIFQHGVIRQVPLGKNGMQLSLDDNGHYSYSHSLEIPEEWKGANMRIVAFVSKSLGGGARNAQVLNSNETTIKAFSSIEPTIKQERAVQVYTKDGKIYVNGENATLARLYHTSGQQVANDNLPTGVYVAIIATNFGTYTRKILVE